MTTSQSRGTGMTSSVVGAPFAQEEPPNDDANAIPIPLDMLESNQDAIEPPRNVFADARPTKLYQTLLLISGFTMIFHIWGINQTFGIFQEYYTSSRSNISDAVGQDALVSLVGTIGAGLTWAGGIFVNPWMARIQNVRIITLLGVISMSLGILLASFCTKLWQLFMTQAILYGVGASMYYFPIMSLTPVYFDAHRGFAMGFILSGLGAGGLVFAPVTTLLMSKFGIRETLRIIGIWNLAVGIPVACVIRKRQGFGRGDMRIGLKLVRKGTFLYQSAGAFLQAAGNLVPIYYMTTYGTSILGYSTSTASLVLALNNAVNSVSRISMGLLADKVGRQNTMIISVLLSALSVIALWYDAPRSRFLAFAVLYGAYAGGYNALLPTTITEVFGVQNYAAVNGVIYFVRGTGTLFGAPIAGLILGSHARYSSVTGLLSTGDLQKRYNEVVLFVGAQLIAATFCVGYVRWLDARDKGRWAWKA